MEKRIGLIGTGMLGTGMTLNLLRKGYAVTVFNRTKSKLGPLLAAGATEASSPAAAVQASDVVIAVLADPLAIQEAVLGTDGAVSGLSAGKVLIDCSTLDPATTRAERAAALEKGASFLDAPITGSKDYAMSGELVFIVGGDDETLAKVTPILLAMGKKVIHAGPSGSGTMTKLCFNLVVGHMALALAESLALGAKSGLDPKVVLQTIMSGTIASRFFEWKGNCMIEGDFETFFSTRLMHKDMSLIMNAGYESDTPLPVSAAVREVLGMAKAEGYGEEDFCSVVKVFEHYTEARVRPKS